MIQSLCLLFSEDRVGRVEKHEDLDRIDHSLILTRNFGRLASERYDAMREMSREVVVEEHHVLERLILSSSVETSRGNSRDPNSQPFGEQILTLWCKSFTAKSILG